MTHHDDRRYPSLAELGRAVDVAAGRALGDLLLHNARLLNVFTQRVETCDILISGRLIAGVGRYTPEDAHASVDLGAAYVAPGLLDGHMHVESSMVTPAAYAEAVLGRGVTGVVCDPHEIANVAGMAGLTWFLEASEGLPFDVWMTAPSCVPATPLGTSGATLGLGELQTLLEHPRVLGMAELMNFPGMIAAHKQELAKVDLAARLGKSAEGHAPDVRGRPLQAYLTAGVQSDHESTTLAEGLEKLRAGMTLMIREGSVTRDLEALMPLITPEHAHRISLVTDDRLPHDLLTEGGVDYLVRHIIQAGINPALAVMCGTYTTAQHYRLDRYGAVAPGYFANIVVLDDLHNFHANHVYKDGVLVAQDGELIHPLNTPTPDSSAVLNTVNLPPITFDDLRLAAPVAEGEAWQARAINPIPYQVITQEAWVTPKVQEGIIMPDPEADIQKLVCVHRHGHNHNIACALATGTGLRAGALASSIAHDHHNIIALGVEDGDIKAAVERLAVLGGGFVAVKDGEILAELALPFAGLITGASLQEVSAQMEALDDAARALGVTLPGPFMALSFMGLEVIPALRLTDQGLIDVNELKKVPLVVPT